MTEIRFVDDVSLLDFPSDNIAIIDSNVMQYHRQILEKFNIDRTIIIAGGETSKNWSALESLLNEMFSRDISRNTHVISIGGGAVSDLTGLAASLAFRGLKWSVVPTTILSMVDAGLGGKTAINSSFGKNLIGQFHFPESIFISDIWISSLPEKEIQSGLGEIYKYAFLSKEIYLMIKGKLPLKRIIKECVNFKEKVVEADPYEKELRKILNLGHTFGHAYEALTNESHGISVVWGLDLILEYLKNDELIERSKSIKKALKIDSPNTPIKYSDLLRYIKNDKKKTSSQTLSLVLLEDIGKPFLKETDFSSIEEFLIEFN